MKHIGRGLATCGIWIGAAAMTYFVTQANAAGVVIIIVVAAAVATLFVFAE